MNMKNRFREDWKDKHDHKEEPNNNNHKVEIEVTYKQDGDS